MFPPTYQMRPLLCTWADTRAAGGQSAGAYGQWLAGIWPSWTEALADPASTGGALSAGAIDQWTWTNFGSPLMGQWASMRPDPLPVPVELGGQIVDDAGKYVYEPGAIVPSRALRDDPVPVDIVDGGTQVTLGGITVRNTHSRRRQWVIDLLLDGALDVAAGRGDLAKSAPQVWQDFLSRADLGVTIYLYSESWATPGALGYAWAYAGAPNRISGALVDATSTKWSPPQTGKLSRYEVTITIAEVTAPGRMS